MRRLSLLLIVPLALMGSPLLAATIAEFNFETGLAPSLIGPQVTASNVTAAPGNANLSVTQTVNSLSNGELRMAGITTAVTSAAQALAQDQFATIALTADPGWLMDLSSFNLLIARGGASAPRGFVLRSSLDGFASDLFSGDSTVVRPVYEAAGGALGAGFANLSAIEFRLYAYGSPGATSAMYFDDISIEGAMQPIPEPASLALLVSGLALVMRTTSRRRR